MGKDIAQVDGVSHKLLDTILWISGTVFVTLVLGAYGFAWIVDDKQTKEKDTWRSQHAQSHRDETRETKQEINRSIESLKDELKGNQEEIKELLKSVIELQERTNSRNKENRR